MRCIVPAFVLLGALVSIEAFTSSKVADGRGSVMILHAEKGEGGIFQGVKNFFAELDAFMDDASAR